MMYIDCNYLFEDFRFLVTQIDKRLSFNETLFEEFKADNLKFIEAVKEFFQKIKDPEKTLRILKQVIFKIPEVKKLYEKIGSFFIRAFEFMKIKVSPAKTLILSGFFALSSYVTKMLSKTESIIKQARNLVIKLVKSIKQGIGIIKNKLNAFLKRENLDLKLLLKEEEIDDEIESLTGETKKEKKGIRKRVLDFIKKIIFSFADKILSLVKKVADRLIPLYNKINDLIYNGISKLIMKLAEKIPGLKDSLLLPAFKMFNEIFLKNYYLKFVFGLLGKIHPGLVPFLGVVEAVVKKLSFISSIAEAYQAIRAFMNLGDELANLDVDL